MDAERSSSPAHSGPPAELEARLQTAVEAFLDELRQGAQPDRAKIVAAAPELAPRLDERLRLVELVFHAGQRGREADDRHPPDDELPSQRRFPAERARRLKCPHCGNRVQLVEPRPKEVTCVNCGSSFRVEANTTATYHSSGPAGTIGRFQILELLGRGAFGEVYKARDGELDRFVALKFPRADYFANSEDARRFLREARSAAGLRHPGIVQVHEIAHAVGSPYIVSDFIDGLTLADLISGGRPDCRESAELVAQLADALDYAHRQKVIHRDIKPSNILLASCGAGVSPATGQAGRPHHNDANRGAATQFVPYLTDFGLARRDEAEMAVTLDGQVLGTPAYMSPEQAAGDHARVDGRSDVYSLGVVLYELLSGELPFRGSRRMLLHQVLHDEPRPPRTLNDRIPRDLETICLKAMAKEPARRYATAADFRDDLRRYLCGDAIRARRVGRLERVWRWSRRNPTIAGLAASLAFALIGGTGVASYFAMAQRVARIDADTLKGEAIVARDHSDRVAARSLIAPLNPEAMGGGVLSRPEREALWELATLADDAVWLRYIDEGTRDPRLATAVCARSEPATIAAVGLNLEKRDRAAALLLERLHDQSLSVGQRAEIAFFALELVEEPGPMADACTAAIREANVAAHQPIVSPPAPWLAEDFWRAKSHLEPNTLTALMEESLRAVPDKSRNEWHVASVLAVIADRLDPADAERSFNAVLQYTKPGPALWPIGNGLLSVAARMDSHGAARVRREAADVLKDTFVDNNSSPHTSFIEVLFGLVNRMEPSDGAAILMELLNSASSHSDVCVLAERVAAVAARMDDSHGSRLCVDAARILVARMRAANQGGFRALSKSFAVVAGRVQGTERVRVCHEAAGVLTDAFKRRPVLAEEVGEGLAEIAGQLQADDAARICSAAARLLTDALQVETDSWSIARIANEGEVDWGLGRIVKACTAMARRLGDADRQRLRSVCSDVAPKLLDAVRENKWNENTAGDLMVAIFALSQVAAEIDPRDAAHVCTDAARVLVALHNDGVKSDDEFHYSAAEVAAMGLAELAPRMQPSEAAELLTEALRREPNASVQSDIAQALAAVVLSIDGAQRVRICTDAAGTLTENMRRGTMADLDYLASGLKVVAAQLGSAAESARAAAASALFERMGRATDEYELRRLALLSAEIAAQTDGDETAPLRGEAVSVLIAAMRVVNGPTAMLEATKSLLALCAKIKGVQRGKVLAGGAHAVIEARDYKSWDEGNPEYVDTAFLWATSLALLAHEMEPNDAARVSRSAIEALWSAGVRDVGDGAKRGYEWRDEVPLVQCIALCDSRTAADAAWLYAQIICSRGRVRTLDDLLTDAPPRTDTEDADRPPRGCRLSTPQLVELLKMPTCFGAARRVILDHLERRYDRRFNTVWAFVRFAEAERLGLDFTTPPVRPDPANLKLPAP